MSSPSSAPRQVNALQALALLGAFLLMAGIGGVLSAALVMPAIGATSALTDTSVRLFEDLPTELEQVPLSERSQILAADGTLLANFYDQNRIIVALDQISPHMINAVVDTEDRRFYEHGGVDLAGMGRAIMTNALTDETQGASTLTQQYIKNTLIQAALQIEDEAERAQAIADAREADGWEGYARKLQEAKLAVTLEQEMTKDEILQGYLNIAQFGASVYGVEAAAQHFFSISAKDLNYLQAATIAGVTNSPTEYDPERNPEVSQGRRDIVLANMLREGHITQEEYDSGIATPLVDTLVIGQTRLGCMTAEQAIPGSGFFCDYVTKIVAQNPAFGATAAERRQLLLEGGLTIHTTLDPRMQSLADASVKNQIPTTDASGISTALSVVEPGTGKVLAMAQNKTFNNSTTAPPGETAVNYNTDFDYGGSRGFQPGSTFKPFTLLQWLKEGHSLRDVVSGTPRTYKQSEFSGSCATFAGADWKLRNAEGGPGFMTVADATKNSVNNAYADMATQLDMCGIFAGAQDLGVHTGRGEPLTVTPSNIIGTDDIAPLTMAAAFAGFSADGMFCEPIAITAVEDRDGNPMDVPSANCRQAITPQLAAGVTYGLSQVWNGTASTVAELSGGRPASGKTGTTSENEHTWFVGYTKQLSAAVWVGHADGNTPMQDVTVNGRIIRNVYGATLAGPIWRNFVEPASDGMPVVGFAAPPSSMVEGVRVAVPDVAGLSESAARSALTRAGFNVKVGEAAYSDVAAGLMAGSNPGAGSRVSRGSLITLIPSNGPDPASQQNNGGPGGGGPGGGGRPGPGGNG